MKIEIEFPDQLANFLKELNVNLEEYAKESVLQCFRGDFDLFRSDIDIFVDLKALIKKHNLKEFIHTYDK